jgi:hypothetical protein
VSEKTKTAFDEVIQKCFAKGLNSKTSENLSFGYCIPHHGIVLKDKSSSRLKVLLDSRVKTSNATSSNDILYSAKTLQLDIGSVLLNRQPLSVVVRVDIRRMYLQTKVLKDFHKYRRYLSRFSSEEKIENYQFNFVTFGMKCSLFVALCAEEQSSSDAERKYPSAFRIIKVDINMDTVVSLIKTSHQLTELLILLKVPTQPRHIAANGDSGFLSLIRFSDESENGYRATMYLYVEPPNSKPLSRLICAKLRVALLKTLSILHLELCDASLLAQSLIAIRFTFASLHRIIRIKAFPDSTMVLNWIHSSPYRWQIFFDSSVSRIQDYLVDFNHFNNVEENQNPAQCLSRGLDLPQMLDCCLWFGEPPWFKSSLSECSIHFFMEFVSDVSEIRTYSFKAIDTTRPLVLEMASKVSSWARFFRCVVYAYRFFRRLLKFLHCQDQQGVTARQMLLDEMVRSFCNRWRMECLHSLRVRQKRNSSISIKLIEVGQVVLVLVSTDGITTLYRRLRIVDVHLPVLDGVIRSVKIRTKDRSYLRPAAVGICSLSEP